MVSLFGRSEVLSEQKIGWLEANPDATIATFADLPPFAYIEDGELKGFCVDIHKLVVENLGIDLPISVGANQEGVDRVQWESLESGEIGGFLAGSVIESNFMQEVDVTLPIMSNIPVVYARSNSSFDIVGPQDLNGLRVGYKQSIRFIHNMLRTKSSATRRGYLDWQGAIDALLAGDVDLIIGFSTLRAQLEHYEDEIVGVAEFGGYRNDSGYLIHQSWKQLRNILNKGIAMISESEFIDLEERWGVRSVHRTGFLAVNAPAASLNVDPTIRLVTQVGGAPVAFLEGGELKGMVPDFIDEISNLLEVEIELIPKYGAAYGDALISGEVDGVFPILAGSDFMGTYFAETDPVLQINEYAYMRAGEDVAIETFSDLSGQVVGLVSPNGSLEERLDAVGATMVAYSDTELLLRGLEQREIDFAIGYFNLQAAVQANPLAELAHVFIDRGLVAGFGIRPDRPELLSSINSAIERLDSDRIEQILSRWQPGLNQAIDRSAFLARLTKLERLWLSQHPVIRVGSDSTFAPIAFQNRQGQYSGISINYIRQVEGLLGVDFVIEDDGVWSQLLQKAKDKEIDMFSSIAPTSQRREFLRFTEPYIRLPNMIFVGEGAGLLRSLDDLRGRRVSVGEGFAIEESMRRDFPEIILIPRKRLQDAIELVENGEVDAFVGNILTTGQIISEHRFRNVRVGGSTPYQSEISFGVREDWEPLVGILEKAIAALPSEEREAIYQRWAPVFLEREIDLSWVWKVSLPVLIIVVLIIGSNRLLKREVAQRTKDLKKSEEQLRRSLFAASEGDESGYFERMVLALQEATGATYVIIGEYRKTCSITTLAVAHESKTVPNFSYKLKGTPCEKVTGSRICIYEDGVTSLFPDDQLLIDMAIEAYVGWPIIDRERGVIGIVVCLYDRPIARDEVPRSILELYSLNIGAEMTRKLANQELRDSRENLRITLSSIGDGVIATDCEGHVVRMNPVAENLTGWSIASAFGKHADAVFNARSADDGIPISMVSRVLKHAESFSEEKDLLLYERSGFVFDIAGVASPIIDKNADGSMSGVVLVFRSILEQKQAERQNEASRQMLNLVLNTIPVQVFWKDRDGVFLGCNNLFANYAECETPDEVVGQTDASLGFKQSQSFVDADRHIIEQGEARLGFEEELEMLDGSNQWLRSSKSPLFDPDGEVIGVLGTFEIITDQIIARQEAIESEERTLRERHSLATLALDLTIHEGELASVFDRLTEIAAETLEVERCGLWLFETNSTKVTCRSLYTRSHQAHSSGIEIDASDFPTYFGPIRAGGTVVCSDIYNDPRVAELKEPFLIPSSVGALIDMAVIVEGRVRGIIAIDHKGGRREWHSDEEYFARVIASIAAQAILAQERRETSNSLEQTKSYLSNVIDSMPSL